MTELCRYIEQVGDDCPLSDKATEEIMCTGCGSGCNICVAYQRKE